MELLKRTLVTLLAIIIGAGVGCKNNISKEAVHKIDDLLSRRMTVVMKCVDEDKNLASKDEYTKDYSNELDRGRARLEYFMEKHKLMSSVKNEIDGGCEELDFLLEQLTESDSAHILIYTFKNYFDSYKIFIDTLEKKLQNQINTCTLFNSIVSVEMNQQLFIDALDSNEIKKAQFYFDIEDNLIKDYESNHNSVDFKGEIPSEWANEFRSVYDKIHEWGGKFLTAKKQRNESLYNQYRLEAFGLIPKIPYVKSNKLSTVINNILYELDPEIEALEKKSADAGAEAYQLYINQKAAIGEDPNEILGK